MNASPVGIRFISCTNQLLENKNVLIEQRKSLISHSKLKCLLICTINVNNFKWAEIVEMQYVVN